MFEKWKLDMYKIEKTLKMLSPVYLFQLKNQ